MLDTFEDYISSIDTESIKEVLRTSKIPTYESTLLRAGFADMNIMSMDTLSLFKSHFTLFHILYNLQNEFYEEGKYLHVHFMRTFLLPYPPIGQCRYYYADDGKFCCGDTSENDTYCDFHMREIGDDPLELLSSRYFYMDQQNFYKLNEETADDFVNGSWELLSHYSEYKKAFNVLDLPENASIDVIKKQYKYLARQYHPDITASKIIENGNQKAFTDINNAYRLLIKLLKAK